ncbi:hypothetical protein QZH41_006993 [Actinostola sp. cb2023]|nr:hypothetical protein QZH41_006993 [Actinostola sp. cb2023]
MIPGLSNWQIDQARRHAVEDGPGNSVIPTPIKRTRLDPVKTNHFVNFIARPNFLQDVAFGTKDLKLDSGNKEDPIKVANEMKSAKDTSGKFRFSPEDWKTAKQICSFFSRYAAKERKEQANVNIADTLTVDVMDEEEAWEKEDMLHEIQDAVYEEIDLHHPIEFAGHNICSLVKEGKLSKKIQG